MLNTACDPLYKPLRENFSDPAGEHDEFSIGRKVGKKSHAISLDSCFRAYSREEMLTGNDQWYCSKCKEHRDIHKKLELFRVPKILVIQVKRFQSKKGAGSSGRSGFFSMAYAQICQQEKVGDLVDFPLVGLDISKHVK